MWHTSIFVPQRAVALLMTCCNYQPAGPQLVRAAQWFASCIINQNIIAIFRVAYEREIFYTLFEQPLSTFSLAKAISHSV